MSRSHTKAFKLQPLRQDPASEAPLVIPRFRQDCKPQPGKLIWTSCLSLPLQSPHLSLSTIFFFLTKSRSSDVIPTSHISFLNAHLLLCIQAVLSYEEKAVCLLSFSHPSIPRTGTRSGGVLTWAFAACLLWQLLEAQLPLQGRITGRHCDGQRSVVLFNHKEIPEREWTTSDGDNYPHTEQPRLLEKSLGLICVHLTENQTGYLTQTMVLSALIVEAHSPKFCNQIYHQHGMK